jgi:hypothetical protein
MVALAAAAPKLAARIQKRGAPLPRLSVPFAGLAAARSARMYRGHVFNKKPTRLRPHALERPPQLLELAYLELPAGATASLARTSVDPARAELPRLAPPVAVPRSPLLAGVALHLVESRTRAADAADPPLARAPARTGAGKHPRTVRAPAGPARRAHLVVDAPAFAGTEHSRSSSFAVVRAGEVCVLDLARPDARRIHTWRLRSDGGQHLRLLALDGAHAVLADVELSPGPQDMPLPPGTTRLALLGAGAERLAPAFARQIVPGDVLLLDRQRAVVNEDAVLSRDVLLRPATDLRRVQPRERLDGILRPRKIAELAREGGESIRVVGEPIRRRPPPAPIVRGFSGDTALIAVAPRVLLAAGAVVEVLAGTLPQRHPLARGSATFLMRQVHRLALRLPEPIAGALVVEVEGLAAAPEHARKLECLADDQPLRPGGALVRADAGLLWFACEGASRFVVGVPPGLRLVGLSFWPGVKEPPDDALGRPIHHPVRPHHDATRFTLEVTP